MDGSSSHNNSSHNLDDEDAVASFAYILSSSTMSYIPREPCRTSSLTGQQWVQELINGHHAWIFESYRMDVSTFLLFCRLLRDGYIEENPWTRVSVEEAVAMFLVLASADSRQRALAERFQHSTETINRNVCRVVRTIVDFSSVIIQPRNVHNTHEKILRISKFYPWFKDCVGAIDSTSVAAWVPTCRLDTFRSRKSEISQNVLAACDHDMRFVFVHASWEGSANDARVFLDACTREGVNFPMPPPGKYYVVDSAYKNMPGFLAPFRGNHYHLQEFSGICGDLRGWKELFNHRHSSIHNVIERSFGVLKKRFPFLKGPMPNYMMTRQTSMVIACCAVHNFIMENLPYDAYFLEHFQDEMIIDGEGEMHPNNVSQEFDCSDPLLFIGIIFVRKWLIICGLRLEINLKHHNPSWHMGQVFYIVTRSKNVYFCFELFIGCYR